MSLKVWPEFLHKDDLDINNLFRFRVPDFSIIEDLTNIINRFSNSFAST